MIFDRHIFTLIIKAKKRLKICRVTLLTKFVNFFADYRQSFLNLLNSVIIFAFAQKKYILAFYSFLLSHEKYSILYFFCYFAIYNLLFAILCPIRYTYVICYSLCYAICYTISYAMLFAMLCYSPLFFSRTKGLYIV